MSQFADVVSVYNDGSWSAEINNIGGYDDDCGVLEQYTSLKDINGVDIYEGDIVNISGSGLCTAKICAYHGVVYECTNKNMFDTNAHDVAAEKEDIFVIGNIHESPELLES